MTFLRQRLIELRNARGELDELSAHHVEAPPLTGPNREDQEPIELFYERDDGSSPSRIDPH